jgi:hypothetical protein
LMDRDTQTKLAALLRAAAAQTLSEDDFWNQFKNLVDPFADSYAGIAHETATHYWGNFHARNLLLVPVRPDVYQVTQGKEALNLIAEGLEHDWPFAELKRKLADI